MNKTAAYTITTPDAGTDFVGIVPSDGVVVATRTDGKAADKLAKKLTAETGQVHRVYTPTGKLRLETEVTALAIEPIAVEITEVVEEIDEDTFAAVLTEADDDVAPYATVMAQLTDDDEDVRQAAKAEWARRLEIYREASRSKDEAARIVGPAMAAALEAGATDDGRTRAALIRRGLAEAGEGRTLLVNEAGRAALAAAVAAVA